MGALCADDHQRGVEKMSKPKNQLRAQRITIAQIEKALKDNNGVATFAAKALGISYSTMRRRIRAHPKLREIQEGETEKILDVAEHQLFKQIAQGSIAAIIFFLKTKGKHRGYIERGEITGKDGAPIELADMTGKSMAELREIAKELIDGGTTIEIEG
jgi:hypothetical protein